MRAFLLLALLAGCSAVANDRARAGLAASLEPVGVQGEDPIAFRGSLRRHPWPATPERLEALGRKLERAGDPDGARRAYAASLEALRPGASARLATLEGVRTLARQMWRA